MEFRYRLLESTVQLGARFARLGQPEGEALSVVAWLAEFDAIVEDFAASTGGKIDSEQGGAIRERLERIRQIGQRSFTSEADALRANRDL